jgi:isoquinoline 1-oxidoreductase beta subunit
MHDHTLSRREALKAATAAAAALVLPIHAEAQQLPNDRLFAPAEPGARIGHPIAYLRIGADGRATLLSPTTECGQGTHTGHAMIFADELGLPLERFTVEVGQPGPDFRRIQGNEMNSGGSLGTRYWYGPFRKVAAQAREMLIAAAAQRLGVPAAELVAADGRVTHPASGRSVGFGELVAAAMALPVPENPPLKPDTELRYLRRPTARLDTPAKVTGAAKYGSDIVLPGMVYAVAKLSPVFRAELDGFDRASVASIPGIIDVVPLPNGVAVVAANTWAAMRGAKAVAVRFKPTPHDGLDSAAFSARMREALSRPGFVSKNEGDVDAALASAARVVEATYEVPYLAHACMETDNCTARINADGTLELWLPTQHQDFCQGAVARVLGIPRERIAVHTTWAGGGFGRRYGWGAAEHAALVAKAVGRPVKLIWTREDEIGQGYYRPAQVAHMRAGLDAQGRVIAFHFKAAGPGSGTDLRPYTIRNDFDPTSVQSIADTRYRFGAFRTEYVRVDGPPIPWIWRAVGATQCGYFVECFLDEVAAAAGKDPLSLRRELLAHDARALAVLNTAAEKGGWGRPAPAGVHRGLAYVESYGSLVAEVAEVSVTDGRVKVHKVTVAIDCGEIVNPETVAQQAEGGVVMGLSAALHEGITIRNGRSEATNFDLYPIMRIGEAPVVETHIIRSGQTMGGVGEPPLPPAAPALVNAIFAATGKRIRTLPVDRTDLRT